MDARVEDFDGSGLLAGGGPGIDGIGFGVDDLAGSVTCGDAAMSLVGAELSTAVRAAVLLDVVGPLCGAGAPVLLAP